MRNADNLAPRRGDAAEYTARFQNLVQSPLRAGILRFMCARPEETFDVEALMQTFGRMRLDVENCVRELAAFGIAKKTAGPGGLLRDAERGELAHAVLDVEPHPAERLHQRLDVERLLRPGAHEPQD